jgi:NADH-quinone oxidoreductase subunit C
MPDETKSPHSSPEGAPKPPDQSPVPGGAKASTPGSVQSDAQTTTTKPSAENAKPEKSAAATPAAAAAPVAKPAVAPSKAPVPTPAPWDSPMIAKFKSTYGSGIEPLTYAGQNYMVVDRSMIPEILQILRNEEQFDYCVDITAVHYPKREKQFDVIWVLYSFSRNERIRVKAQILDGESIASSVPIWPAANWLEREVFDMFGIKFDGHPDMKRILLPEGWKGYPLRKDYGILQQDNEWVQINLGIESGQ